MAEYVDHVDENDNVIGRVTRDEAHAGFLRHRAVHILIETSDGRIVLHQVKRTKRAFQLHLSMSAAGHVEAGQSYEETATKELQEELGIATPLRRIGKFHQNIPGIENEFCAAFFGRHDGPFSNWEIEAENLYFFTRDELDFLIAQQPHVFTPGFKNVYRLLRESENHAA